MGGGLSGRATTGETVFAASLMIALKLFPKPAFRIFIPIYTAFYCRKDFFLTLILLENCYYTSIYAYICDSVDKP